MTGVTVRPADADELTAVLGVLDAAALATDRAATAAAIERGDALVAVSESGTVVGACVREGERIRAIAVRRRRRGQGIGTALVARAARDRDRLVAACEASAVPFYEALGFDVRRLPDGRYCGVLDPAVVEPE